jgi:hypothetical protein
MQQLIDAIKAKFLDSTVYNDVGGRVEYRKSTYTDYPRIIYSIITSSPDNVFARKGESVLVQVDIFSADSVGDDLMNTIYSDLRTLLDNWQTTIAGYGKLEFTWQNTVSLSEDIEVGDGSIGVNHIAVDYEVTYQAT